MFNLKKKNFGKLDRTLVLSLLVLIIFGLIVLFSATKSLPNKGIFGQVVATILGIILIFFILLIDIDFVKKIYITN